AAFAAGVLLAVGLMRQFVPNQAGPTVAVRQAEDLRQGTDLLPRISFVSNAVVNTNQDSSQTIFLLFDEQSGEAHLYFRNVPMPGPGQHYVVVARDGLGNSEPLGRIHIDGDGQGQIVIPALEKAEAASLRLELRAHESADQQDSI
ncbi:MAG: hypothetical protein NXI32_27845, partial [bacterium]|nr:hypothetical protein [bacterium]